MITEMRDIQKIFGTLCFMLSHVLCVFISFIVILSFFTHFYLAGIIVNTTVTMMLLVSLRDEPKSNAYIGFLLTYIDDNKAAIGNIMLNVRPFNSFIRHHSSMELSIGYCYQRNA